MPIEKLSRLWTTSSTWTLPLRSMAPDMVVAKGPLKGRCGGATAATCCSATSTTTAGCAIRRQRRYRGRRWRKPSQRSDPRPAGPLGGCRARRPPRHPTRGRRVDDGAGQPVSGSPAEPPQRRGGEVRRQHLFHRSVDVTTPPSAMGTDHLWSLSSVRRPGHADAAGGRLRGAQRPGLLARREHSVRERLTAGRHSGPSTCRTTAPCPWRRSACSPICAASARACRTG